MRRGAFGIAVLLLLAGVFTWNLWDKGQGYLQGEVSIEAEYNHPIMVLSITPPQAAEYLEVTIPQFEILVEREAGQIRIMLGEKNWIPGREYTLTAAGSVLDEPFWFTFQIPADQAPQAPEPAFDLVAVGDVMLDQITTARLGDYDVNYPLARIKHITGSGDLNFANLEVPLSDRGEPADKRYVFRAPPYTVEVLTLGGFNVVSLANNHILDYGPAAMSDTIDILNQHNIAHAGAGANEEAARRGALLEINGVRVAVLAYTRAAPGWQYPLWAAGLDKPGTVFYRDQAKMLEDLARAKSSADVVIVSMHWGNEYTYAVNDIQKDMGRLLVDNGADLILGHHSHAPQGIEFYKDKPIVYGLGNFLFYPFELDITDETYILKARIGLDGVESMHLVPVLLGDSQPFVPQGSELERMQGVLGMLLDKFGTGYTIEADELVITMP